MLPPSNRRNQLTLASPTLTIVRRQGWDSPGLASSLLSPRTSLRISERKTEAMPWPKAPRLQAIPSLEDIKQWQAGYHPDKRREEQLPWRSRKPRTLRTPVSLTVRKLRAGVSLDYHSPPAVPTSPISLTKKEPTSLRLFPAATDRSSNTLSPVPSVLASLTMNAATAFTTAWRKQPPLQNCVFLPALHEEFVPEPPVHHRKKNPESVYQEEMTRMQNMMGRKHYR